MRISSLGGLALNFLPSEEIVPLIVEFHCTLVKRVEGAGAVTFSGSTSKYKHLVIDDRRRVPVSFLWQNCLNLLV
jgi:hypothetical protein